MEVAPRSKSTEEFSSPTPHGGNMDILACSSSWASLGAVVSDVHHFEIIMNSPRNHRKISATEIASSFT